MFTKLFLLIATAFIAFSSAGNAIVSNRCLYDIWIWSINGPVDSGPIKLPARTKHIEPLQVPNCEGCGTVFKVSKTNQLVEAYHTQFEYAINATANVLYYDISYVNCAEGSSAANCPGWEMGHAIDSPEKACGRPACDANTYCPEQAYFVDTPLLKLGIKEPVVV